MGVRLAEKRLENRRSQTSEKRRIMAGTGAGDQTATQLNGAGSKGIQAILENDRADALASAAALSQN